jgi:hypothetical protein
MIKNWVHMNMINSLTSKEFVSQISNGLIYTLFFSKVDDSQPFDVWIKKVELDKQLQKRKKSSKGQHINAKKIKM